MWSKVNFILLIIKFFFRVSSNFFLVLTWKMIFVQSFCDNLLTTLFVILKLCSYSLSIVWPIKREKKKIVTIYCTNIITLVTHNIEMAHTRIHLSLIGLSSNYIFYLLSCILQLFPDEILWTFLLRNYLSLNTNHILNY